MVDKKMFGIYRPKLPQAIKRLTTTGLNEMDKKTKQ